MSNPVNLNRRHDPEAQRLDDSFHRDRERVDEKETETEIFVLKKKDSSNELMHTIKSPGKSTNQNKKITSQSKSVTNTEKEYNNKVFWRFVVLCICIVWSTNFAVIKSIFEAVPGLDASLYSAIRFTIAAVVMLPRAFNSLQNFDLIARSAVMGFFVFLGYYGQGVGMSKGSSADKSAFICSLNCVWVALVQGICYKDCNVRTWFSVVFAVSGVAFLELNGSMPVAIGDIWLLLQPIGFGTGYLLLENLILEYPNEAAAITSFKLLFIGLFSILWTLFNGKGFENIAPVLESTTAICGILYCSLFTTVAALWVQSIAFKKVSAKDVSIILCSEPLWATVFSACEFCFCKILIHFKSIIKFTT